MTSGQKSLNIKVEAAGNKSSEFVVVGVVDLCVVLVVGEVK